MWTQKAQFWIFFFLSNWTQMSGLLQNFCKKRASKWIWLQRCRFLSPSLNIKVAAEMTWACKQCLLLSAPDVSVCGIMLFRPWSWPPFLKKEIPMANTSDFAIKLRSSQSHGCVFEVKPQIFSLFWTAGLCRLCLCFKRFSSECEQIFQISCDS